MNSLGPWVIVPSGVTSFRVLRVRKPWSLSHAASWFSVVVPEKYRSLRQDHYRQNAVGAGTPDFRQHTLRR